MLEDEQKIPDNELVGVRAAVKTLKKFFDYSDLAVDTMDGNIPEEWLAHLVFMEGDCDCDLETAWDEGRLNVKLCAWYDQLINRQEWYCYWHGISLEEFRAKIHAEQEERAAKEQRRIELDREMRRTQLHELAREFGVDENLLP